MAKTTSTDEATRSVAADSKSSAKNPVATSVEDPETPFSIVEEMNTTSQLTYHENQTKKMESAEECWAHRAAETTSKAAKTLHPTCPTGL